MQDIVLLLMIVGGAGSIFALPAVLIGAALMRAPRNTHEQGEI